LVADLCLPSFGVDERVVLLPFQEELVALVAADLSSFSRPDPLIPMSRYFFSDLANLSTGSVQISDIDVRRRSCAKPRRFPWLQPKEEDRSM